MTDDLASHEPATHFAPVEVTPVHWRDLRSWFAPWLLAGVLVVTFLFGLLTASGAADDGTYAVGFLLAGGSLLGLGWDLRVGMTGGLPSLLVETAEGLAVVAALLSVLALAGLIVAAQAEDAALHSVGYALALVSVVLLGWNLKHYCDVRDRAPGR